MSETWTSIDWVGWLPWAVFGLVSSLVWLTLDWWSGRRAPWQIRLGAIRRSARAGDFRGGGSLTRESVAPDRVSEASAAAQSIMDGTPGRDGLISRVTNKLATAARRLTPSFLRSNTVTSDGGPTQLERRLARAGYRGESAAQWFVAARVLAVVVGLVLAAYGLGVSVEWNSQTIGIVTAITVAVAAAPDVILQAVARRRQRALEREMPDALDLLVVCVEAGQGLDHALRRIAELLATSHSVVADELNVCVRQLQIGRSRAQVLRDLGERNSSDSLRGLTAMLVQADRFGVSIGAALRSQSESLRTRRRQRAEEQAAGISVKLVFPLVLFTFPALLAVLVGPAALHLVRDLFPLLGS